MDSHNLYLMEEHVQRQHAELLRAAQQRRLASDRFRGARFGHRLLSSVGAALVQLGASLQRYAGQPPARPVRI